MKLLSRVLKYDRVKIDDSNRVTIETREAGAAPDPAAAQKAQRPKSDPAQNVLEQATKGADLILKNAESKAARLINEARAEAEALVESWEAESRSQGYDDGYGQGSAEALRLRREAEEVLQEARDERRRMLEAVEGEVVEIIVNVLRKLLADTIQINPQVILTLIRAGFADAQTNGAVIVRVSDGDYETVLAGKDDIAAMIDASATLEIMKDLSLAQSDCLIETPYGVIDCSLGRQLEELTENLYRIYQSNE